MPHAHTGRRVLRLGLILMLLLFGVSACGQKGELYLPDKNQAAVPGPSSGNA